MRISDWSSDVCSSDLSDDAWRSPRRGRAALASRHRQEGTARTAHIGCRRRAARRSGAGGKGRTPAPHHRPRGRTAGRSVRTAQLLADRSEEHTSELQSLMRISYAVFCLKKKNNTNIRRYLISDKNK